jgi:Ca-activated chloride channel homolog
MSFASPLVLLALLAIPLVVVWYAGQQRRRVRAAAAFVAPALTASVAPRQPRWRRHAPMLVFALALAVLIGAAARPQRSVAVPITDGAIMLANDVSSSMRATDVAPSRLGAGENAAKRFLATVPSTIQVGLLEFAKTPVVLQSPTTNHSLTSGAFTQLRTSGGTAVGYAIQAAVHELKSLPLVRGKLPPGAIVMISDGAPGARAAHPDLHRHGGYAERHDSHHARHPDRHHARARQPATARPDREPLRRPGVYRLDRRRA